MDHRAFRDELTRQFFSERPGHGQPSEGSERPLSVIHSRVHDPEWWSSATPAEIADAYFSASALTEAEPAARQIAAKIRSQLRSRYWLPVPVPEFRSGDS